MENIDNTKDEIKEGGTIENKEKEVQGFKRVIHVGKLAIPRYVPWDHECARLLEVAQEARPNPMSDIENQEAVYARKHRATEELLAYQTELAQNYGDYKEVPLGSLVLSEATIGWEFPQYGEYGLNRSGEESTRKPVGDTWDTKIEWYDNDGEKQSGTIAEKLQWMKENPEDSVFPAKLTPSGWCTAWPRKEDSLEK